MLHSAIAKLFRKGVPIRYISHMVNTKIFQKLNLSFTNYLRPTLNNARNCLQTLLYD